MKKIKYEIKQTSRFKKEYRNMKSRSNFDEKEFIKVVTILANGEIMPEKYCNHLLEPKRKRYMGMPYKT